MRVIHRSLFETILGASLWGLSGNAAQVLFQEYRFPVNGLVAARMLASGVVLMLDCSPRGSAEALDKTRSIGGGRVCWITVLLPSRDPILQRTNCNATTVSLPSNGCLLRGDDRMVPLVQSMDTNDHSRAGWYTLPRNRRISQGSDNASRVDRRSTGSVHWCLLHSRLETIRPKTRIMVDNELRLHHRRTDRPSFRRFLSMELPAPSKRK
jgi:hypothetical protein